MGNHRLRQTMIQLAWLWPIHQPNSALTRWYRERTKGATKLQKKKMVVALARKLLVALWRYVDAGVVIEGCRAGSAPPGRAEASREERTFFHRSAEVRSTSVDPGGRTDGLLEPGESRSEEGTRPPEPTACESGIRVRSLKRDDRMLRLFRLSTRSRRKRLGPGSKDLNNHEAKLMETLENPQRSAAISPTPADHMPSISCS